VVLGCQSGDSERSLLSDLPHTFCKVDLSVAASPGMLAKMTVADDKLARIGSPLPAVVTESIKGNTTPDEQIAVRLVEDPDGPFNGMIVSVLAGERWLTCAREQQDGTLLPLDGTRRRVPAPILAADGS
jgi:hypothetical protein